MYARVAVASNALNLGGIPPLVAEALHEGLTQSLLAHGRLVFSSNSEAMDFVRAIKDSGSLPPGARQRWVALLTHLQKSHRVTVENPPSDDTLASIDAIDRLISGWEARADVAVVADALSLSLGIPLETGVLTTPGRNPDVVVPAAARNAPALARIVEYEQTPVVPHGSSREEFWSDVLEPMATGAAEATILDRYLFNRICDPGRDRYRAIASPEHICWLVDRLDSVMASRSTVRLIGAIPDPRGAWDARDIASTIHDRWSPMSVGRLGAVEVHLADPRNERQRFPHDRHIRFSTGGAVKVPAGFDRLSDERIRDTSGMWWDYLWQPRALDGLRSDERSGVSMARHPRALALSR